MGKVTVMGSFIYDVTAYVPRYPVDGETVLGYEIKTGPGGKGANQATSAAKCGAETTMIVKTGKDDFANALHENFRKVGISEKYVYESETEGTGAAVILVHRERGENRIAIGLGANATMSVEEVARAEEEIAQSDILLTQFETNAAAIQEFGRLGRKYNKPIMMNPAPFCEMPENIFEGVDYLTPNETEAAYFSGMDKVETTDDARKAAQILMGRGAKSVLITLGGKGAFYYDGKVEYIVAPPEAKVVDTTGAGDAFNGAFATAISEGKDILTAIKFANCVATISVTRQGTSSSLPTREEADALFEKAYL